MPVAADIVQSWFRPRAVIRRLLARGTSEAFALSFLLIFLALSLAAISPGLARQAWLDGGTPVAPRLFAAALGLLATLPLWYLLAALGHLAARALGGRGSHFGGRLALFWSLLAVSPGLLLQGLVLGFVGPGQAASVIGIAVGVGFLSIWVQTLREVES